MKKVFKYIGLFLTTALLGTLAGCDLLNPIEETEDLGLGVKVFFPTKVVPGQPMTINGSGFKDATAVVFPDNISVTDFEIVSNDMIRVTAPAGVAEGKLIVSTGAETAESPLAMTVGSTVVSGFSKQAGEEITGGEQITIYGTDLEFINSFTLMDPDGNPLVIPHEGFYRKGTSSIVITLPKKVFEGTYVTTLGTFDGKVFSLPELTYKSAVESGHWETVKTMIWENDGSHGEINWSSDYRFASETNKTGEEIYAIPDDVWAQMKSGTFYVLLQGASPQVRVTTGWWSTTWTGNDIMPGNELLTDNGDGTWTLAITLDGDPILDVLDTQHLLLTGGGYTPLALYFSEDIWVPGPETQEVKVPVWTNDGSLGEINWGGDYRFAPASNSTGEECYTVPQDVWDRLKTDTFYVTVKGASPQIRVTTGWWSTTWTGNDIFPGNELLTDNGDGTWTLTVNLADDPILDVLDAQHLLFTGGGYSVEEIYFIDVIEVTPKPKEVVIWENDGSHGAVSWSSDYRFSNESNKTGEEIYAIPDDVWAQMKAGTFYVDVEAENPQIRITTGWWSTTWTGNDFMPGSEGLTDNGDGTWTLAVTLGDDPIMDVIDVQHLLVTGDRFTPLKLYRLE